MQSEREAAAVVPAADRTAASAATESSISVEDVSAIVGRGASRPPSSNAANRTTDKSASSFMSGAGINGVRAANRAKGDVRALDLMLKFFKVDFLTQMLLENDYTYDNLHLITESDLTKLRITNKAHRHSLLSAAKELGKEFEMAPEERNRRRLDRVNNSVTQGLGFATRSRIEAAKRRDKMNSVGSVNTSGQAVGAEKGAPGDTSDLFSENTATIQTANEHARCAQIYLEHHRIDRAWPRPQSKLSQTLHLNSATVPDAGKPLYTVIDGTTGARKVINPPCKHNQGFSSKFCRTCAEFVSQSMAGQWQFQTRQKVVVGDGEVEYVDVWKVFKESDNLAIEYAHRRNSPSVKVKGKVVDFDGMQWGLKAIRRVDADVVPFPTLSRGDIIRPRCAMSAEEGGTMDDLEQAERDAAEQIRALQRKLITDTEESRSRLQIEQSEQVNLRDILDDIAAAMNAYHSRQRAALEAQEEAARSKIEGPEYQDALEKLNKWEEESVRNVAIQKWTNDCNAIYAKQWGVIELMEEKRRAEVEEIEEAARGNLEILMGAFNAQIRAMQLNRKKSTAKAIAEIESGLRCVVCRRRNCVFHKQPWKAHWKTLGGALDLHPFDPTVNANLSVLMGNATEHEWHEAKLTDQTERRDRRAKSRMHSMLSNTPNPSPSRLQAQSAMDGSSHRNQTAAIGDVSNISYGSAAPPVKGGGVVPPPLDLGTRPHTAFASSRGLPSTDTTTTEEQQVPPPRPASAASTIRAAIRISRVESSGGGASRSRSGSSAPHRGGAQHSRPFYNSCTNPSSHTCMPDTVSRNTKVSAGRAA